ncbi:MAG: Autotransporter-associated beta strand repeat protein [Lentisphaerae bacterium ADurb.BinA184]|nr:MAG: Autotransporter-associated beta strand repeat protein [Lentisphaerae bacterium ADurb.BinA184]
MKTVQTLIALVIAAVVLAVAQPAPATITYSYGSNVDITSPTFWSPDTELIVFNTHNGGTKTSVESVYGPHSEANPIRIGGSDYGGQFMTFDGNYDLTFNGPLTIDGKSTASGAIWERAEGVGVGFYSGTPLVTFTGGVSETYAGAAFDKVGPGTLVLTGTSTYTGETRISGGALRAVDGVGIPATTPLFLNGGVFESNGSFTRSRGTSGGVIAWGYSSYTNGSGGFAAFGGPLTIDIDNNGPSNFSWNSHIIGLGWGSGDATLIMNSVTADSAVTFIDNLDISAGPDSDNIRNMRIDDNPATTTDYVVFSGIWRGTNAAKVLVKAGAGRADFDGDNTYAGSTQVNAGTVNVNGATTGQGTYTVAIGATLGGTGTIGLASGAGVTVDGTLAPGLSVGRLTVSGGNVTFGETGVFRVEVNGLTAGTEYDQLVVTGGGVSLDGELQLAFGPDFTVNPFDSLTLIDVQGTGVTTGTFQHVDDAFVGAFSGRRWRITYDGDAVSGALSGGNDVLLYAIPEPGVLGLLSVGGLALGGRRAARRRVGA